MSSPGTPEIKLRSASLPNFPSAVFDSHLCTGGVVWHIS